MRSKARANDSKPVGGAVERLEKKKAADDLAASKKAIKESASTMRKMKKKEPTAKSSKKTSNVYGSPLKDKSNEYNFNVPPSKKGTTMEAEMGTKLYSVISNDSTIADLTAALKQAAKELAATKKAAEEKEVAALEQANTMVEEREAIIIKQELVEQQSKNAKLIAALKQANTTVEEREAIIIKLKKEAATQQRLPPPSTPIKSPWGAKSNIPPTPRFFLTPIKSVDPGWKSVGKYIRLEIAPYRTLSTKDGDPSRASLGEGYLSFEENLTNVKDVDGTGAIRIREPGYVRRVNYYNTNGVLVFQAELPDKKSLRDIQGNAGADFMFAWDVVNEAHSSLYRRYVFAFPSMALLSVALYHIFYNDQRLMEEFFDVNGSNRFYAKEENVPAHKVVTTESDMDIDGPKPRKRKPTYSSKHYQKKLGLRHDVYDVSPRWRICVGVYVLFREWDVKYVVVTAPKLLYWLFMYL